MTETTTYALIQDGYGVLGLGATPEAAIADAGVNADDVSERYDAVDGALYVLPCTARLADAVRRDGGALGFEVRGRSRDATVDLDDGEDWATTPEPGVRYVVYRQTTNRSSWDEVESGSLSTHETELDAVRAARADVGHSHVVVRQRWCPTCQASGRAPTPGPVVELPCS